jgi:hypothetical protein
MTRMPSTDPGRSPARHGGPLETRSPAEAGQGPSRWDVRQSQRNHGCFEATGRYRFRALDSKTSPARNRLLERHSRSFCGGHGNGAPMLPIVPMRRGAALAPLRYPKVLGPALQTGGALLLRRAGK